VVASKNSKFSNEVVPRHHHLLPSNPRHLHPTAAHHRQPWISPAATIVLHPSSLQRSTIQPHHTGESHHHERTYSNPIATLAASS